MFASAVENAAATVKKSTGVARYKELSDILTKEEVSSVNGVLADLRRNAKTNELASKVSGVNVGSASSAGEGFQVLNSTVTVIKSALQYLQRGNQVEYNRQMSQLLLEPAELAKFMTSTVKKGKIAEFTSSLTKGMDAPTLAAFKQAFIIPTAAAEVGGRGPSGLDMPTN